MRARTIGSAVLAIAACAAGSLVPDTALAIPAFARLYDAPCSSCHYPVITRRSEFGDAFRKAGYRWPTEGEERIEEGVELRGTAPLTAWLPRTVPIALSAATAGTYTNDPDVESRIALGQPSLTVLMGAPLGRHLSFFGTWSGTGTPDELYVHFGRLFDRRELNLRVGLFEQSTTLFKSNEALLGRYVLGSSALNGHAVSQSRLGVEANGVLEILGGRTFWAAGVVRNAGLGSNPDVYYHVEQKIGGMDFLGEEPEIDVFAEPSPWEEVSLHVGHFGYAGRVRDDLGTDLTLVRRLGLDLKLSIAQLSLWGGVMLGYDRLFDVQRDFLNVTWFGEVSYPITPWLTAMYVYQYQDSATFERETQRHDAGLLFMLIENVRGRLRFGFSDDDQRNEVGELQLFFAF